MSEALQMVLAFGFAQLGASRIEASHALWNHASARVLEKAGFQFVRFLAHGFQKRGEWVAENKLAITQTQWQQQIGSSS